MNIEISNHPFFSEVKRKLEFNPLVIDYKAKVANWGFSILHFDADGESISNHLPDVQGNFHIDNTRKVNAQTGVKIAVDADAEVLNAGVPEFDFLSQILKLKDVDPLVLGVQRVKVSDARGVLNDYGLLMGL